MNRVGRILMMRVALVGIGGVASLLCFTSPIGAFRRLGLLASILCFLGALAPWRTRKAVGAACGPGELLTPRGPAGLLPSLQEILSVQALFTIVPIGLLAAIYGLSIAGKFVPGILLALVVGSVYLLPAYFVVNHGFGYRTIEGAPPLPMPATSIESFLIILAAHALLVTATHVAFHLAIVNTGRLMSPRSRHSDATPPLGRVPPAGEEADEIRGE